MKKTMCAFLCLLTAGCRNSGQDDVVKETYIHKYDVPVAQTDWNQTQDGKIVQLLKDGVTVTYNYAQGILDGETTYTFPNSSTIHFTETYEMGLLKKRCEHYISGIPMHAIEYQDATTVVTEWYPDGTPLSIETYQDGLLTCGEYHQLNNTVDSRIKEGFGFRLVRNHEGELVARETFKDGLLSEQTTFFANNDPASLTAFENGEIHGTRYTFLPGGVPHTVETWERGFQEGITTVYQNGEKYSEITYVKGKKHGIESRFRDGTLLVEEITWKNDMQHGPRHIFVDDTVKTEWFHQNELVSRTTYERLNPPR